MAENLHEYKSYRKQLGLLPEPDHQGVGACAYNEAPGVGWLSCPKLWAKS
jgi:hypothetical protein